MNKFYRIYNYIDDFYILNNHTNTYIEYILINKSEYSNLKTKLHYVEHLVNTISFKVQPKAVACLCSCAFIRSYRP